MANRLDLSYVYLRCVFPLCFSGSFIGGRQVDLNSVDSVDSVDIASVFLGRLDLQNCGRIVCS